MSRVSWPAAVPSKKALQDIAQIRYRLVSGGESLHVEAKNIFAQDRIGWKHFATVPFDIQFPVSQLVWRLSCFSDIYIKSQYKGSMSLKRYMKYYDMILDAVWDHSENVSREIWSPSLLKWCEDEYNVGRHSTEALENWTKDHEGEKITFSPENMPELERILDERLGWIYGELVDVDWKWDSVSEVTGKKIQEEVEEWLDREEEIRKNDQDRPSSRTSKKKTSKKTKERKISRPKGAVMVAEIQGSAEPTKETKTPETTSSGEDARVEQETTAERTEAEAHESPRSGPLIRGSPPCYFPENPGPSINLWEMIQKRRMVSPRKGSTQGEKTNEIEEENDSQRDIENSLFNGSSAVHRDERDTEEEEIENSLFEEDNEEPGEEIESEKGLRMWGDWPQTSQKEDIMGMDSWDSENLHQDLDEIMEERSSGYHPAERRLGDEGMFEAESSSKRPPSSRSPFVSSLNSEGESEVGEEPGTPTSSELASGEESEESPVKRSLGPTTPIGSGSRIKEHPEADKGSLKRSYGPGRPTGSKNKPKERPVIERRNPVRQKRPRSDEDEDSDLGMIVVDLSPKKKPRQEAEKMKRPVHKNKGKERQTELEERRESALQREKLNRVFRNLEHDLKALADHITQGKEDGLPHFVQWLEDVDSLIKQEPTKVKDVLTKGLPQRLLTLLVQALRTNKATYPIYFGIFGKTFLFLKPT